MTYEPWNENSFLIRFEHLLEVGEDSELSKPVTFNLTQLFPGDFEFAEVNLAANQWIEDVKRLHFQQEGASLSEHADEMNSQVGGKALENVVITLKPMEIRSFIMSLNENRGNHGIRSQTVFKLFPLIVLAVLLKNYL